MLQVRYFTCNLQVQVISSNNKQQEKHKECVKIMRFLCLQRCCMAKSEQAKENGRRRQREYYHRKKQKQALSDIISVSNPTTQILGGFADKIQNKVANKVSTTMVNELSDLIRPSSSMLSDKPLERNYLRGALYTLGGMVAGYFAGSLVHHFVYAGIENQDDTLAKFRLYGIGAGGALGGGTWYLNEEKQHTESQTSLPDLP